MSVESGGGRRIDCDVEPFGCREGNNDQQNTIFMTCKDDYENINAILFPRHTNDDDGRLVKEVI